MKTCISCGMPMKGLSDFAGGDPSKDYCIHCAKPDGSMQSFTEKKDHMTQFIMQSKQVDRQAAEKLAEDTMKVQPAWKAYF
ncbi:zinc ribbon domain-containing protein [Bacillus sp. 1P06AnD]|uniref:zinc ribbon domain-containing protein n=1 Tax=Bacillus sp. 1P06AnD TaxID=3132208 RepID=UPI0039A13B3F